MKTRWIFGWILGLASAVGLAQTPGQTPGSAGEKALCTATATCAFSTVQCHGHASCTAVDRASSPGERGHATCDGATVWCPREEQICHLEQTPAATLLLPYFEVDTNPGGSDTLVAIANAFDTPVVVKAEIWSDLGVAIFGFNIWLDGQDVQTFSLFDALVNGVLPNTQAENHPSCQGILPPPPIPASRLTGLLQPALRGLPTPELAGNCAGYPWGDTIMRGYMTFDTVPTCSLRFPGDPGYFSPGGTGDATNQNVLWGDYYYHNFPVTPPPNPARVTAGFSLVPIRASATDPATSNPNSYTFYGVFNKPTPYSAADNRQPLATNFGVRFFNTAALSSDLIVWRDPKVTAQIDFTCGKLPAWYPLGQERLLAFDESGNSFEPAGKPFPAVTQRVRAGTALSLPFSFGWLYLNLNGAVTARGAVNPPLDPRAEQAWVTVLQSDGTAGAGLEAVKYDTACDARHEP